MQLIETTFRKIISDYILHRLEYGNKMVWKSQFGEEIVLYLEAQPFSQESQGYDLDKGKCE